MACYRNGGCGPYEQCSCTECPASKPEYLNRDTEHHVAQADEHTRAALIASNSARRDNTEPRKLYISDWHYNHKNCLAFDNRPFTSIEQMNQALVERWNSVVRPGDIVYVLGDMFWCNADVAIPVLDSLAGQIFLVKGNHDRCHIKKFTDKFVKVAEYMEIEDKGRNVVLCHYPIPCFKNHFYGWYHLYGHVHNSFEFNMMEHTKFLMSELYTRPCQMFNVGAMMPWMDYTPRTLDEIVAAHNKTC